MHKSLFHTGAVSLKLLFLASLLLPPAPACLAQEADDSTGAADSAVLAAEAGAEDTVHYFDKVVPGTYRLERRTIADSVVRRLRSDKDFWYANEAPAPVKRKAAATSRSLPFFLQPWFRTLLWTIIVVSFIAILAWYLLVSDVRLFRRAAPPLSAEQEEDPAGDIFSINYRKEVDNALAVRDYRLAVRLLYLQSLKELADRHLIRYDAGQPNRHYLEQLYSTPYYKDFFRLTQAFEYAWYGRFDLPEGTFRKLHQDFIHFKQRMR